MVATDRELSASEVRRVQLRQRDTVHRLGYVVVGANRRRRRVTSFHHVGGVPKR